MDFLKKWLPLIGYKTAINLFLISLYPFLFFVLSSINSYVSSLIRFQIRTLTVSECFAWLFIVAIALSVYLGAVFIVKAKVTYLFIFLNTCALTWFAQSDMGSIQEHIDTIAQKSPIILIYDIGFICLFAITIIILIFFKKYHFTLQQRFLH